MNWKEQAVNNRVYSYHFIASLENLADFQNSGIDRKYGIAICVGSHKTGYFCLVTVIRHGNSTAWVMFNVVAQASLKPNWICVKLSVFHWIVE